MDLTKLNMRLPTWQPLIWNCPALKKSTLYTMSYSSKMGRFTWRLGKTHSRCLYVLTTRYPNGEAPEQAKQNEKKGASRLILRMYVPGSRSFISGRVHTLQWAARAISTQGIECHGLCRHPLSRRYEASNA